jgi:thioesterase domain-containing protein
VQPLPIPVHLFAATEGSPVDPVSGWSTVVPESLLRVIRVAGTHHSIMLTPNVEGLGKTFSNAIRNAAADAGELPERSYSSRTTLQYGRHNLAPLFCVPGAGASITSFIELADALEHERPIYGLQPRGLEGELVPHSTVQAASQFYLRTILDIHPTGPLHLLGHSFGGWVVFDIAQRLLETGREIGSLTILDSEVPESRCEYNNTEAVMAWIEIFEQILERPLGVGRRDLNSLNESAQRKLLHERMVSEGLVPPRSDPGVLRGPLRIFAISLRTHYRPEKVYPGPVQLILVDNPKLDQDANRRSQKCIVDGWKQWAPNLICTYAPGNHMTVLKPPHVQTIARLLQHAMSDIRNNKEVAKGAES